MFFNEDCVDAELRQKGTTLYCTMYFVRRGFSWPCYSVDSTHVVKMAACARRLGLGGLVVLQPVWLLVGLSLLVLCTVVLIWVVVALLVYGVCFKVVCGSWLVTLAWDPVPDADKDPGDLDGEETYRSLHSRVVPAVTRQSNPDAVVRWIRRICGTSAEWEETYVPLIMSQSIDGATILSLSTERLIQLGFRESHAFLVFDKLHPQDNLETQTPDFG